MLELQIWTGSEWVTIHEYEGPRAARSAVEFGDNLISGFSIFDQNKPLLRILDATSVVVGSWGTDPEEAKS